MNYGFIGAGNMGSAIISGLSKSNNKIYAYDIDMNKINSLPKKVKYLKLEELIKKSDVIVLAIKPQMMDGVIEKIKDYDFTDKLFITIAAGLDLKYYEKNLNKCHIIRVMPNINAIYGEAISAICKGRYANNKELKIAKGLFENVGEVVELEEKYLSGFTAIAGSSPAFTFMYADALALAGVRAGIPRDLAMKIVNQAIKGSIITLSESKLHPDVLRDKVCSPNGTTIEGVKELEEKSFKGIIM